MAAHVAARKLVAMNNDVVKMQLAHAGTCAQMLGHCNRFGMGKPVQHDGLCLCATHRVDTRIPFQIPVTSIAHRAATKPACILPNIAAYCNMLKLSLRVPENRCSAPAFTSRSPTFCVAPIMSQGHIDALKQYINDTFEWVKGNAAGAEKVFNERAEDVSKRSREGLNYGINQIGIAKSQAEVSHAAVLEHPSLALYP